MTNEQLNDLLDTVYKIKSRVVEANQNERLLWSDQLYRKWSETANADFDKKKDGPITLIAAGLMKSLKIPARTSSELMEELDTLVKLIMEQLKC